MGASVRDLKRLLEALGCECDESGDHIRYILKINGRIVARTTYSHSWRGNMQISDVMLNLQAKQMQCSNRTWRLLVLGQAPKDLYFKELLQNGHISQKEFDDLCQKQ